MFMHLIRKSIKYLFRNIYMFIREKKEQLCWLKENPHNKTKMGNYFPRKLVCVGKYTYGKLNVHHFEAENEGLSIGNYCSIGPNVEFFLGGEHHPYFLSNYPFGLYFSECNSYGRKDRTTKGKIVIEDDVWIGANAIILSGVKIGQGAIIGAGTVVAKNVPPYAIYVNGRVVAYRFSEEIIEKAKKIDYSNISYQMIVDHIEDFYTRDIRKVVDKEWIPQKK